MMVLRSESSLPSSSTLPPLKVSGKLQMEDCSIEFGKCVANHDCSIVVGIHARARFVDRVNNVIKSITPCVVRRQLRTDSYKRMRVDNKVSEMPMSLSL
jgi:hypothetical protein